MEISHLCLLIILLVFCEPSKDQLTYLSWLTMWFEVILGLRINLEKSKLISTGRVENFEELSLKFGCKVDELPFSYLGLLYAFLSSLWQCRMEWRRGFSKRLAMWKRHISKGGRLTLIQSTLSNMSIYSMSSFYILRTIMLRLEQIQRDFLWGGEALEWKPHLVR